MSRIAEPVRRAFVGRTRELDELGTALADATAGHGGFILVSGEPGIGKTRLAVELVTRAGADQATVVWGRSWEGDGAPPFWPWVQLVRGLAEASPPERLRADLGSGAAYVLQVVPELADRLPGVLAPTTSAESPHARFYLFDAIAQFLKRAAHSRPLFFVLDDLHWADKPSLLLLEFVARELADAPVLLIGTYREAEARQPGPLAEILASLARLGRTLPLRGLNETEVATFLARQADATPAPGLVTAVHAATRGNPFFIDEIARLLVAEGITQPRSGSLPIPETVRAVIRRRLALLPETSRRALAAASAVGSDFEASLLERASGLALGEIEDALAHATTEGLVARSDRASSRHVFAHALVRETLYEDLSPLARQRLHAVIAEALEEVHRAEPAQHLAELANHFFAAGPSGDSAKALEYCARAGDRAMVASAYEEAAGHYERALTRVGTDDARRSELLLSLATAFRRVGDDRQARELSARAGELATKLGDTSALARAALTFSRPAQPRVSGGDPESVRLLERALGGLGGANDRLRAQVLARLARELQYSDHEGRASALSAEAVEIARRLGDAAILSAALTAHGLMLWTSVAAEELVAIFTEALRLAEASGDLELTMAPRRLLIVAHLRLGDPAADREIEKYVRAGDELRQPFYQGEGLMARGFLARIRGRFAEAEATIREGRARQASATYSSDLGELILFLVRVDQGRLTEIPQTFETWIEGIATPFWRGVTRALFYTELGRRTEAQREFEQVAANDFSEERLLPYRNALLCNLSLACVFLGDARRAMILYDLLRRYAGEAVVTPVMAAYNGSLVLAMLATTLCRFDEAREHFEEALVLSRRMDARMWTVRTQYEWAKMLLARGVAADRDEAARLLGEAIAGAVEIGMQKLAADARELKASCSIAGSIATHAAPDGTVTLLFSDVEGFTAMTERLGDRRAHEVMREHNEIVRAALASHDGHEVELMGDGFLLAFSSARRGLDCAVAIQKRFAEYNEAHADEPLHVRMGLHTGDAIRDAHKFFGRAVILAARIAAAARGGEILVSSLVRDLAAGEGDLSFGPVREVELKGLAGTQSVCAVGWNGMPPSDASNAVATGLDASPSGGKSELRREGDYWSILHEQRTFRLKDTKGLRYLAELLRNPGHEFHVLDLVASARGRGDDPGESGAPDLGDAGPLLDPRAKAEYRKQLDDLRDDLEEAERFQDLGRAAKAREEIAFLSAELARATGLGGRDRSAGAAAERARLSVTLAIKSALKKIAENDPALGGHLTKMVKTGRFCSYTPDPRSPITWS